LVISFLLLSDGQSLFAVEEQNFGNERYSLRRSHLEIRMDILACVQSGIEKPTQIMYKANLSWTALKEHLDALETSLLLKVVEYRHRRKYELTEKALGVIAGYRKILEDIRVPVVEKRLKF
jgi:predicted transcriptional regulator